MKELCKVELLPCVIFRLVKRSINDKDKYIVIHEFLVTGSQIKQYNYL